MSSSSLLQNRDLGCDTTWGVRVAPHQCCLKVSLSCHLPAHSHPGPKNLSAAFHPSSGNSGLTHQLPVSLFTGVAAGHGCDALRRDWTSPKHPQLSVASDLSHGMSYTPRSFCAGKARKEKVNISMPVEVAK